MHFRLFAVIIAILLLVMVAGCDKRDGKAITIPKSPYVVPVSEADQILYFSPVDTTLSNLYWAVLMDSGYCGMADSIDTYVIEIGSNTQRMEYSYYPGFPLNCSMPVPQIINPGQHVVLKRNGTVILETTVNPVAHPSVAFPATYDLREPLELNWSLDYSSQYQFVMIDMYFGWDVGGIIFPDSSYCRRIDKDNRSYFFPANSLIIPTGQEETTFYYLGVEQVNYKVVNHIAVMVTGSSFKEYYQIEDVSFKQGRQTAELTNRKTQHIMQLYNMINKIN